MKKKILTVLTGLAILGTQQAKALDGQIIFRDSLYGAGIGALGGLAIYATDGKDFGKKVGTGVLIGLIFGVGVGIYESQTALVEINNGKIYAGIPQINIKQTKTVGGKNNTITEINLLGASF